MDDVSVPLDAIACSTAEQDRLIAFLLCAFLSLRRQDGGVSAHADTKETTLLRYRIEPIAEKIVVQASKSEFPFLALHSFRNFAVLTDENGTTALEAYLHPTDQGGKLCANSPRLVGLRFVAC